MTHYDVDYSQLKNPRKRRQALLDVRAYTGRERYAKIREIIRKDPNTSIDYWHMGLSFAGIQGYPVTALLEAYKPEIFKETA